MPVLENLGPFCLLVLGQHGQKVQELSSERNLTTATDFNTLLLSSPDVCKDSVNHETQSVTG